MGDNTEKSEINEAGKNVSTGEGTEEIAEDTLFNYAETKPHKEKDLNRSKIPQILLFCLIAVVILGGVCTALILTQPKQEETVTETEDTSYLTFDSHTSGDVASVHIVNALDDFTITRVSEAGAETAEYGVEALDSSILSQSSFTSVIGACAAVAAKELVEENVTDLAKYGLAEPQTTVEVTYDDGTTLKLALGNAAPIGNTTYLMVNDINTVYTIYTTRIDHFAAKRFGYVNLQVMPQYDSEAAPTVDRITIDRIDLTEPMIIEALPVDEEGNSSSVMNTHTFVQPYDVELDATNGSAIVYGLYGLTASEAAWVGLEEEDYELAGLNEPNCVVKMQVGGLSYTLTLGKAVAEETTDEAGNTSKSITGFYGTFSEVPNVLYIFPVASLPWLGANVDTLMARLFCTPYIYDLESFSFVSSDYNLTVGVEGDSDAHSFTVDGETISGEDAEDRVKTIYQYLLGAYGEEIYTDEEKGELLGTLTYRYDDAAKEDTVIAIYYSASDRKIIFNIDGKNLFKCRQIYGTRLIENVAAFYSGGEIITSW